MAPRDEDSRSMPSRPEVGARSRELISATSMVGGATVNNLGCQSSSSGIFMCYLYVPDIAFIRVPHEYQMCGFSYRLNSGREE